MLIQADKEGASAIQSLCDIALRKNGINNLNFVSAILTCLDYPDKPVKKPVDENEDKKES